MTITSFGSNYRPDVFWAKMGQFFASPAIRKELGLAMSDSPNHIWVVVTEGDGVSSNGLDSPVMGFGAIVRKKDVCQLVHAYVLPEYRRRGVYREILAHRILIATGCKVQAIRATCTEMSRHALKARGFVEVGTRGKYDLMELKTADIKTTLPIGS